VDAREFRFRQAEIVLEQLRHQTRLRHSDLQRRFAFALTLVGGVFLSSLRAEVPRWGALAAIPFGAWAGWEMWRSSKLAEAEDDQAQALISSLAPDGRFKQTGGA
jgi:hypothetical protein